MTLPRITLTLTILLTIPQPFAHSADRYVRPGAGGNGSGTDWTNAYISLPATLVRGDVYYLADGTYGAYTFDDPATGSSIITIKKALESDHGTNTGWTSTYGDGQAQFSSMNFYTDYYLIDGGRRDDDWKSGSTAQYGIRVYNSGGIPTRLDNGGSSTGDFITFRYVDFEAPGRDYLGDNGGGVDVIYSLGSSNITFSRCALHDSDRTIFLTRGINTWTIEYSYIARNGSSPAIHGEIMSDNGSDNITFRYNIIEDPEGTATWAILNGSGGTSGDANAWSIYGNVISHTSSYNREGISGVVFCANDASNNNSCSNWKVYNNTIYTIKGLWSGFVFQSGSGNVVQNNIWYSSVTTNNGGAAFDYNWYYNTGANGDNGANKQTCTSNCALFVDPGNKDFRLVRATNAGATLPAPYNQDMDGAVRSADGTWDRGAYEFGGTVTLPLPGPSNLRTTN